MVMVSVVDVDIEMGMITVMITGLVALAASVKADITNDVFRALEG